VPACIHKFDEFELDPSRFELRRNGRVLKLERIPMELLLLLLEKDGSVVTRQEIIDRLWGKEVFVDTEHGINTAIRKIRQTLKDDPERPRFVQTVTGKGYRFVAEINGAKPQPPETMEGRTPRPPEAPQPMWGRPPRLSGGAEVSRRSRAIIAVTLLLATASALIFLFRNRIFPNQAAQIHSLAVLPLTNLSGDTSQEYFADGMTDELITALAKNQNLRVVSRTSVMQYKGVKRPLPDIARELNVDGILEGSISRSSNRVHMTVQLIYAPTDTHVWAESYDRDLNHAYSLPSELSETIAKEVKTATSPSPRQRYINPEAHDAYLHGRYFWFAGNDQRSQEYFEKAIQIQSDYAPAWAGLADSYGLRGVDNEAPAKDLMEPMEAAARKAVELDDSLPDAHHALAAWYFFFAWDLPHADAESRRAIELDPSIAEQHHLHSYILMAMDRNEQALQEQQRATELDPFTRSWGLGHAYLQLRQFDAAIGELRMRADALPNEAMIRFNLSNAYWHKGMWKESERELEKAMQLLGDSAEAQAEHKAFQTGGEKSLEQLGVKTVLARAQKQYVSPFEIARQYACLGDRANTLKFLEQSYREHYPWLILLQTEPDFDFLHNEPRYRAIVQKLGLPPAY
jgi:TolB-like protein/DNA-binding winged helix-turn-helix (wHTH) protein/Tfp pilus assembly protein PilF